MRYKHHRKMDYLNSKKKKRRNEKKKGEEIKRKQVTGLSVSCFRKGAKSKVKAESLQR